MNREALLEQLEALVDSDDFEYESEPIVEQLAQTDAGLDTAEALLRLMERHPFSDFGMPGAAVHFIESLSPDSNPLLLASVKRRPAMHTVWMLSRCLNAGDRDADYLGLLQEIAADETLEPEILESAQSFAEYHLKN